MIPFLVNQCTAYIWSDVDVGSACRAYEFAKLFDEHGLMNKCLQVFNLYKLQLYNLVFLNYFILNEIIPPFFPIGTIACTGAFSSFNLCLQPLQCQNTCNILLYNYPTNESAVLPFFCCPLSALHDFSGHLHVILSL